ncbi:MAG: GTPase domain-containing protein [Gammaproteobacteria bacterium]|nr:GTPase domain-containing protein [Gammaproteobacteria bacterium]MDH5735901.1 GTPase domain-containing protein [Gammaproteobacteria bacterium]
MSEYDELNKKLTLKLVFYGPALSGKTTNLTRLHDLLDPELKGEMMILETKNDRTLFFDLLPLGMTTPTGFFIKLKLFTVPGQVAHDSTRKAVLSRADGVVFVADSQISQSINNAESFQNLSENAARVGLDFETMPMVVQFNKRDLPDIQTEEEVNQRWKSMPWELFFSCALQGDGVKETFAGLLKALYRKINADYKLEQEHQLTESEFIEGVIGKSL